MKKIYVIFPVLFILTVNMYSQTITIKGQNIIFGSDEKDFTSSIWKEGNQIESNYPYITMYEYSDSILSLNGLYNQHKLIGLYIGIYSDEPSMITEQLERSLITSQPYKSGIDTTDGPVELVDYYQTSQFYIKETSFHMAVGFQIYPIEMLSEIRKEHSEFAKDFFY